MKAKAKKDTNSQSSRPKFGKIPDLPDDFKAFLELLPKQFGGILPLVYIVQGLMYASL